MDIANDGDLGELGQDRLGAAADGVSPEAVQAVRAAMNDLDAKLADHAKSAGDAESAVALQESWVEVGRQVLTLAKGVTDKLIVAHQAQGPQAPKTNLIDRIFQVAQGVQSLGLPIDPLGITRRPL